MLPNSFSKQNNQNLSHLNFPFLLGKSKSSPVCAEKRCSVMVTSFFKILLFIIPIQAASVYSFMSIIANCADLKSFRIATPCQYDSNCVENAYCRIEFCYCKDNYVLDRNRTHFRCLRVARGMGDPCEKDVQCQLKFGADAECRENRCECSSLSRFVEERCYKTAGLGEYCQSHRNCYVEGSRSFCETGRCVCPLLHHPSSDGARCVKSLFLQEDCTRDEECVVKNSRCIGNCTCDIAHVLSSDKKECLKKADAVGESCQEDSQCQDPLQSAKCEDGMCSCIKGYHRRSTACYCSIGLNQSCENHFQCTTPTNMDSDTSAVTNVDCIDGVCTCSADHTFTSDGLDCIGYVENGVSSWRLSSIALIIASLIAVN